MKRLSLLVLIAAALSACAAKTDTTAPPQGCTEEAKVCDDGSTVVRGGPDCEFQACPGAAEGVGGAVACTQEAKVCDDGSYVSRTGPDCAFEACPGEADGEASPTGSDPCSAGEPCLPEDGLVGVGVSCEGRPADSRSGDGCPAT